MFVNGAAVLHAQHLPEPPPADPGLFPSLQRCGHGTGACKKGLAKCFSGKALTHPPQLHQSCPCSHHHQNQAQRLQASWGPKALCGGRWYRFPGLFLGKLRLADWSSLACWELVPVLCHGCSGRAFESAPAKSRGGTLGFAFSHHFQSRCPYMLPCRSPWLRVGLPGAGQK